MGYGIRNATRRFPTRIRYCFKGDLRHDLFVQGMKPWVDTSVVAFEEVAGAEMADFLVEVNDSNSIWSSGDGWNGRAEQTGAAGKGVLRLSRKHQIGDVIHEFGHLLGLGHEQDRQGCSEAAAWREKLIATGKFAMFKEVCESADRKSHKYDNYGSFDPSSIMLYGSGYQTRTTISAGDAAALSAIYALR